MIRGAVCVRDSLGEGVRQSGHWENLIRPSVPSDEIIRYTSLVPKYLGSVLLIIICMCYGYGPRL